MQNITHQLFSVRVSVGCSGCRTCWFASSVPPRLSNSGASPLALVKRAAQRCSPASSRGGRPAVRSVSALATAGVLQKALAAAATEACGDQHAACAASGSQQGFQTREQCIHSSELAMLIRYHDEPVNCPSMTSCTNGEIHCTARRHSANAKAG